MVKLEADALEHSEDLLVEAARANPRLHQMPALKPIDEDFVFNSTAEDVRETRVAPVMRALHAVLASNHVLRSFWTLVKESRFGVMQISY